MMSKIHTGIQEWPARVIAFGMIFLLLNSMLISILSPMIVSAQDAAPPLNSPTAEATIYESMRFLMSCGERNGWHSGGRSSISTELLNEGQIYDTGKGFSGPKDVAIGYLAERDKQNGRGGCTLNQNGVFTQPAPDVVNVFQTIGKSGKDFALDSQLYFNDNDAGGGYDVYNESDEERSTKILNYFKKQYPGFKLDGDMSEGAKYFNWKATFIKECADGEPRKGGTKKVQIVKEDGSKTELEYNLKQGSGDRKAVGFGMGNDNNEQTYTCDEIITGMNNTAGEGEKVQKAFVAKGGTETPASTEGTKSNCESQAKISTAWILCAFLDTVDAILVGGQNSPGLIDITESLLNVDEAQYNNNQLKAVWSYFRSIATFLLILVALVMIIGQAVSKE